MNNYTFVCRFTNALTFTVQAKDEIEAWKEFRRALDKVEATTGFRLPAPHAFNTHGTPKWG